MAMCVHCIKPRVLQLLCVCMNLHTHDYIYQLATDKTTQRRLVLSITIEETCAMGVAPSVGGASVGGASVGGASTATAALLCAQTTGD
jgi:hypothetical protein